MTDKSNVVAVGIDIGSSQSRVAVCSSSSENAARVVSNTLGHRSTLSMTTVEEANQYIHGEAALRLLQKEKKPASSVREILNTTNEEEQEGDDAVSCEAFVGHLASLASDATASSPQDLRVVLSVPMDALSDYVDTLKGVTEAGIKKSISDKRQRKHHIVVGVIFDAVATCIAHGLLGKVSTNNTCYKNILVVDAGASGLNLSHLKTNGTSQMLSLVQHKKLSQVSGPALVTLMSKHVASQFERKHKIPAGDVWESKRARYKLLAVCESALASLKTSSSSIHITVDGLYEGMDCHLPLSKPRWEMLTAPLLKQAQGFMEEFAPLQPDAVLLAGSGSSFVQDIVTKTFSDAYRGISNIPPDESVALGCALYAASCLEHEKVKITVPMHTNIAVSPVELCIGGSDDENDQRSVLIGKGTPLPAHVVHSLSTHQADGGVSIWQTVPSTKRVANFTKLPKKEQVEVVVELSIEGKLSIAIDGGPITTI